MMPYVLMVDDNPGDLQLLEESFKDCRIPVSFQTAEDAAQAFAHLAPVISGDGHRPDVIIIDLNLPGINGRDLITQLRAHPQLKRIPVVVFSAEAQLNATVLGADEAIRKPGSYRDYLALAHRLQRYWPTTGRVKNRCSRIATPVR